MELKKSEISFETKEKTKSTIKYKIAEKDGKNGFYIYLKSPFNKFDRGESFDINTSFTTNVGERAYPPILPINIHNNIIPVILGLIFAIFIIWYLFGIFRKPRFEKKNHKILINEMGKSIYNGPITIDGFPSSLIPYVPETGMAYDLKVKASDSKNAIIVDKSSLVEGMFYDNDEVSLNKDLKIYEDTPLEFRQNRNKKQWVYTDVVANDTSSVSSDNNRRRRRR